MPKKHKSSPKAKPRPSPAEERRVREFEALGLPRIEIPRINQPEEMVITMEEPALTIEVQDEENGDEESENEHMETEDTAQVDICYVHVCGSCQLFLDDFTMV